MAWYDQRNRPQLQAEEAEVAGLRKELDRLNREVERNRTNAAERPRLGRMPQAGEGLDGDSRFVQSGSTVNRYDKVGGVWRKQGAGGGTTEVTREVVYRESPSSGTAEAADAIVGSYPTGSPATPSPLSAFKALKRDPGGLVALASCLEALDATKVLGIARSASPGGGEEVEVVLSGIMTHPGWSWDMSRGIFLGSDGDLVQEVPVEAAFTLMLGIPSTPQSMNVRIMQSILAA